MEQIKKSGFLLEVEGKLIKSVTITGGKIIKLEQRVISNGRMAPSGASGIVVRIREPYFNGHTSDILEVLFEDEPTTRFMKFKDLLI